MGAPLARSPPDFDLAHLALEEGRLTEAEAAIRRVFELGYANCEALLVFARIQICRGRQGSALEALQRVARAEPENPKVQVQLFNVMFADRRRDDAEAAIRRAIDHAPSIAENHWRLARLHAELGHRAEAERAAAGSCPAPPETPGTCARRHSAHALPGSWNENAAGRVPDSSRA